MAYALTRMAVAQGCYLLSAAVIAEGMEQFERDLLGEKCKHIVGSLDERSDVAFAMYVCRAECRIVRSDPRSCPSVVYHVAPMVTARVKCASEVKYYPLYMPHFQARG